MKFMNDEIMKMMCDYKHVYNKMQQKYHKKESQNSLKQFISNKIF